METKDSEVVSKRRRYLLISWAAVLFWAGIIFWFSSQPARESAHLSVGLTKVIASALGGLIPAGAMDLGVADHLLRKTAHFLIYLVLGSLMLNGVRAKGISGRKGFFIALGFCVLYALSDEFHQLFVPGRGAQLSDVLLDSLGALVGILLYALLARRFLVSGIEETTPGEQNNADS